MQNDIYFETLSEELKRLGYSITQEFISESQTNIKVQGGNQKHTEVSVDEIFAVLEEIKKSTSQECRAEILGFFLETLFSFKYVLDFQETEDLEEHVDPKKLSLNFR